MRKGILTVALMLITSVSINAQSVHGLWKNIDEETGKTNSVIKVFKGKDGFTYGNIVEVMDPARQDAVCSKCDDEDYRKGKKILGMQILSGLKKDGKIYDGGEILDPKQGKLYSCYIELIEPNKLKVKGHIKGFKWIGRDKYWIRK